MSLETIQPLLDWIANHPELSGLIIFLIAFGESLALVGIVVPGVVFMLSIGTLVGLGAIGLWTALVWAALGAIAGDWLSYWLGRHFDRQLRHIWPLSRYPKLIPAGEKFFRRHGGKSVLFGRFVGPLRPVIPAIAGIMHMSQAKFYFMNIVSAILWAPVVIMPGVAFGSSLQLAQEVFGKLIILIVITILLAAFFGYVAKKLFAYALMTTVNTWGELFGFDRARENLTSFSLAGSLILVIALFVANYDQRYQSVVSNQQATDKQWWQDNWEQFSPASSHAKKFRSDFPITIQWWADAATIESTMKQLGWRHASRLTFQNSLTYFIPEPDLYHLPAQKTKLFNREEQLIMVKLTETERQLSVFRLWSVTKRTVPLEKQLWVGVIYNVSLVSPFGLVNVPLRSKEFAGSVRWFRSQLSSDRFTVQLKQYPTVSISDTWQGEVLLISPVENGKSAETQNDSRQYSLQQFGAGNVSLSVPASFSGSLESSLGYVNNGVQFNVRRYPGEKKYSIQYLKDQLRQQLQNPGEGQHFRLVSLQEHPLASGEVTGSRFIARYELPFLGKEMIYRLKLMQLDSESWLVTAAYKQCDQEGERSITAMMDAIQLRFVN